MKKETLGQRLQRLRVAAGLTQSQVAAETGVSLSAVQNWEIDRREPGFRAGCRLAKTLNVTVEELADTVPVGEVGKSARPAGPTRASALLAQFDDEARPVSAEKQAAARKPKKKRNSK